MFAPKMYQKRFMCIHIALVSKCMPIDQNSMNPGSDLPNLNSQPKMAPGVGVEFSKSGVCVSNVGPCRRARSGCVFGSDDGKVVTWFRFLPAEIGTGGPSPTQSADWIPPMQKIVPPVAERGAGRSALKRICAHQIAK